MNGTPERVLLCAMLQRAILDALATRGEHFQMHRRSALIWLRKRNKEDYLKPPSFEWVCLQLDIDPENVRNLVINNTNADTLLFKSGFNSYYKFLGNQESDFEAHLSSESGNRNK